MTDTDVASDFAALMSGAAEAATPADEPSEAPFGWTTDATTGERRPKKVAGRPRKSPNLTELKAARAETPPEAAGEAPGDLPPARKRPRLGRNQAPAGPAREPQGVPQHRPGQISQGVDRLYRRAGKIVRAMDHDIGTAIIESTRKDDEADVTVGDAWEEIARTNPRIRRFLLKMIAGGAWGQLMMAHAPIFMALVMKDGVRKHIPFMKLITALAEPDETASPQEKADSLKPEDLQQMMGLATDLMGKMGMGGSATVPPRRPPGIPLPPEVA